MIQVPISLLRPGDARLRASLLALCLSLLVAPTAWADAADKEAKVKVAILYKLPKFVKWPQSSAGGRPFGLCLVGEDRFQGALNALRGRTVNGRRIEVLYPRVDRITANSCQMLFISTSNGLDFVALLHRLAGKPVLTVSDIGNFAGHGGGIEIVRRGRRLEFRINHRAVKRAGLTLAAPLLAMATIVDD